jgi:hypothetical protein
VAEVVAVAPAAEERQLYGLMAELDSAEALLRATRRAYDAGYRAMDAYSPFPVEGLADALGHQRNLVPWIGLVAGCLGAAGGFALQSWIHVIDLPINVGGRPLLSWPAFIPVTFELAVLGASLAIFAALFVLNGLPQPYHPVFNAPAFARATRDRFFLCVEARDPRFDSAETRRFLASLGALEVVDVPD